MKKISKSQSKLMHYVTQSHDKDSRHKRGSG